ncbi:m-AAA protease-interacting protein 1, mitochondrial-like isoform X2 [Dermacentor albipictus]|uniref:m-AAA protease-interacting protein 1, mitochondrial-like isoform X2 n=1 Tax=Dermacentor albipictus TaxID=60249 RepID=UPI0031FC3F78
MYWRTFQLPVSLRLVQSALPKTVCTISTPRVLCAAHIHTSRSRRDAHPDGKYRSLILQNPLRWLSLFFDFMYLKNQWDPDFNRSEFLEGAKQAISTVLSLIATQKLDDLAGLVKREAVNRFVQEVSQQLGYGNMHYLKEVDDIVAMPHKVALQSIVDQKYCDIQVNFIVMKNLDNGQSSPDIPRVFVCFILAKFHRNYTAGVLPNWTITNLSLLRTSSLLR